MAPTRPELMVDTVQSSERYLGRHPPTILRSLALVRRR
jgi:hypothetical protein